MNTETAIKVIKDMIEIEWRRQFPPDLATDYIEALKMAAEALRKQEPVKPNEFHTEPMYDGWHYQGQVRTKSAGMNKCHFCPTCGQKIDWEED